MKNFFLLAIVALMAFSCTKTNDDNIVTEGYKPVYVPKTIAMNIESTSPAAFANPGKMFLYGNYILVTDKGAGVHIIDNSNPSSPQKLKFVKIPGVNDAVLKNGIMYADNFTDLVAIDISDMNNITLKKRVKNVYPMINQFFPDFATGYFECADTTNGYVAYWEAATLTNPKCFR